MADTKISALTAGTAASTDRIPVAISPFGSGDNRYLTPSLIATWLAKNTLAAGTLTTSQPLTLTQTWNAGGVTFTGMLVNVTNTASAAASLLMDLQVGGTTECSVRKDGTAFFAGSVQATNAIYSTNVLTGLQYNASGEIGGVYLGLGANLGSLNVYLRADAANTLAQRNGTNAQRQKWNYSYTDGSNESYAEIDLRTANTLIIGSAGVGTGAAVISKFRLNVDGTNRLDYGVTNAGAWTISGHLFMNAGALIQGLSGLYNAGGALNLFHANGDDVRIGSVSGDAPAIAFYTSSNVRRAIIRSTAADSLEARNNDNSAQAPWNALAYYVAGTKVVGAQGATVADASGGAVQDAEARTALNALLARVRAHGLIAT